MATKEPNMGVELARIIAMMRYEIDPKVIPKKHDGIYYAKKQPPSREGCGTIIDIMETSSGIKIYKLANSETINASEYYIQIRESS